MSKGTQDERARKFQYIYSRIVYIYVYICLAASLPAATQLLLLLLHAVHFFMTKAKDYAAAAWQIA